MIYSLNEIDVHCKKAARGAGFEWGYAEEIGKAARWLAAYELPGADLLSEYLTRIKHTIDTFSAPQVNSLDQIRATSETLCPIQTGSYLTDVLTVQPDQEYNFQQLGFPLLLLPFLARLADEASLSLTYNYQATWFNYANGKLQCDLINTPACDYVEHADCHYNNKPVDGKNARVVGQQIADAHWMKLNEYAKKTYVPATEESRRAAGPSE